jgi:hypothetical protein
MRYLLAFFGEKQDFDDRDEEAFRAEMDAWSAFDAETVDKGAFVACEGLQPSDTATTMEITDGGERIVTDGPYAETKEQLGGFTLLECESREEALEWARKVPLPGGWKIEIRPVMDFTPFGYVDPTAAKAAAS